MRASRRMSAVLAAAVLAATLVARPSVAGDGYVIVVNERNPVDHLTRAEVSMLFLKRTRVWPGGGAVSACDLSATHPTRAAFSLGVHKKPAWYVIGFWQQEIASGRAQPPKVYADEVSALSAVRENVGGIAYVSEDAVVGNGLKRVVVDP